MSKADRRARLAELAALRKSGKKTFDSYQVGDVQDLYEEVDEDSYKKIVRDRLNQDDFVVDDNGEGYADDGREDWDRVQRYESDSEDDLPVRGKDKSKKCTLDLLYLPSQRFPAISYQSNSQKTARRRRGQARCHKPKHQRIFYERRWQDATQAKGTRIIDHASLQ